MDYCDISSCRGSFDGCGTRKIMESIIMEPVYFKSYKISLKLPLDKLEAFFTLHDPPNWKEYITLDRNQLSKILQYDTESKMVYLFKYGCVCFVNFNENEIYIFLQYIDSIIGSVDFYLFSKFNENHCEYINDTECMPCYTGYIHIICIILAKSVELNKLESDLEELLDKAEKLINFLQSGKLHINKRITFTASRILRMEYHYANNIKIFERNMYDNGNIGSRKAFDKLSKYYELDERRKVIQSKMDDMRNIFASYSSFSYKQNEARTYWFEIALLSLFPLSYILDIFPYKDMIFKFLRVIFP
jgi:required for meiotic nuclear division protein 1